MRMRPDHAIGVGQIEGNCIDAIVVTAREETEEDARTRRKLRSVVCHLRG